MGTVAVKVLAHSCLKFIVMPLFIVRVVTCIETCNAGGFDAEVSGTCDLYWCVLCGKMLVKQLTN
jgi:hypothetical protein